jgi:hemerythrin-like metal-binding protein
MYQAKKNGRDQIFVGAKPEGLTKVPERLGGNLVLLIWHERYQSGEPNIDSQHKKLFEKANNLLDAAMNGRPEEEILGLIDDLLKDVKDHFAYEESVLRKTVFPGIANHLNLHHDLLETVAQLKMQFTEGKLALGGLFTFLAYDLVASHMLGEDRKFFPYLTK